MWFLYFHHTNPDRREMPPPPQKKSALCQHGASSVSPPALASLTAHSLDSHLPLTHRMRKDADADPLIYTEH